MTVFVQKAHQKMQTDKQEGLSVVSYVVREIIILSSYVSHNNFIHRMCVLDSPGSDSAGEGGGDWLVAAV